MADGADADFLFQIRSERSEQLEILLVAILHLDRPDVTLTALEVQLDRVRVAGVLHDALHIGIAPARVDPHLDVV